MRKVPSELDQGIRVADQNYVPEEHLFRRFRPEYGDEPDLDAIQLPDISVNRGKYCEPLHTLWSESGQYDEWGVLRFSVKNVPPRLSFAGIKEYKFEIFHAPQRRNYPHTEIRASNETGERLVDKAMAKMDRDTNLKFREKILEYADVAIRPGELDATMVFGDPD